MTIPEDLARIAEGYLLFSLIVSYQNFNFSKPLSFILQ